MKTVSLHSDLAWLDGRQSPTEARKPQGRWHSTGASRCARRAVQLALVMVPAFFPITAGAVPIIGWARPNYFVAEDVGAVDLVVQRSGDLNGRVNIDFHTEALTATPGADYVEVSGTVTFESGETTHTVTVPILNDGLVEPAEGLFVVLDPPDEGAEIGNPKAMVLLRDNDRPVTVELPGYSVNEDARLLAIRVIRGDDGGAAVTVDYRLVPGTAEPGADYEETSGSLELPPGVPFGTLVVPLLNDTVSEPGEDFQVVLSNPTNGASLGSPSSATITITDTDDLVQFVSSRLSVSEAATMAELTIIRGENTAVATVEVETTDYSAGAGEDYEAVNRNLSWEPGQRLQVVQIPLLKDGVKEPSESFRVTLSNPGGGARLGPNVLATVIILDDDSGVGFTTVRHAVWGKSEVAEIEVSRGSDAWDGAFTVDYHTADGSARAGVDFAETSGTLHFVAGELAKVIPVRLMARADPPQLRTFTITLDNVTGLIPLNDSLQTVFVDIASPAAGYVMNVSPPIEAEAHRNDDRVKITWSGAADLLRSSSVTGPWESLGTVDSPLVTSPAAATAFYQLRSSRPARLFVPSSYDGVE
ncbi:MAG: hypothetical protein KDM81_09795, partial [Verrucomicrobiae bacterium]|nr:hypothetical protein [Verrucomicrobiae bacterium]